MRNVLITGARGFIGKNLVEYLNNKKDKFKIFAPFHVELDLLDERKVEKYLIKNKINIVVHGANVGGSRKAVVEDVLDKNLRMFFNIVRCRKYFDKLILLGSGGEYDKRKISPKVKEEDFDKFVPMDNYGYSKYIMSKYIEQSANMVNLRMFGVFGKYEDYEFRFISNTIVKNLIGLPIEIRQNVFFDYLYVDDCVKIIEWFIENQGDYKFYNLSSGSIIDLYTLSTKINKVSNYKSEIKIVNKGLNIEYSADNSRLLKQIQGLEFTPIDVSIYKLFKYYESIIDNIDKEKIVRDMYADNCIVKT